MSAPPASGRLDLVTAAGGAAIAGAVAYFSLSLSPVGVALGAIGGALVGAALPHLRRTAADRVLAIALAAIGMALGVTAYTVFQAPPQPAAATSTTFIDPDHVVLAPADPDVAHPVAAPSAKATAGMDLTAGVQPSELVNTGYPEVVTVTGSNAASYAQLEVDLISPDGDRSNQAGGWATSNGTYEVGLDWRPQVSMGVSGNAGAWSIAVKDLVTGQTATTQLEVIADSTTPPASRWPEGGGLKTPPTGPLHVDVATEGNMCAGGPQASDVTVTGATPDGGITIYFLDARGRQLAEVGTGVNLNGQAKTTPPLFWDTSNCSGPSEYDYTVVVADQESGRQAKARLMLSTHPMG